MTLIAQTKSGDMPPRNMVSWRDGQLQDDLSALKDKAENGDLDAVARLRMLSIYVTPRI